MGMRYQQKEGGGKSREEDRGKANNDLGKERIE
jgi:hypothetical protein